MGGRAKSMRRAAQRRELPMEEWSDETPDSVDADSVGKPYAERDEKGGRLEHKSTDPEGRWTLGDFIRKEGTMCSGNTEQRDWGGPDPISDSELTTDNPIEVKSEPPKNKRIVFPLPSTLPIPAPASFAPGTVSIPTDSSPIEISAPSSTKERGPQKKRQVTSNNIDGNYLGGSFGANITKGFSANQPAGVGTTQVAAAIPLQTSQASTQDIVEADGVEADGGKKDPHQADCVEADGGKKDPPRFCYTKGCVNIGAFQPFKKDSRPARTRICY